MNSTVAAIAVSAALAACVPQNSAPVVQSAPYHSNAMVEEASPRQPVRPGFITTNEPAPEVIYRPGSHDSVLGEGNGPSMLSSINSQNIETPVTQKAKELSHEADQLQENIETARRQLEDLQARNNRGAADYYAVIAAVSAELQAGTTPGNPILVNRWNLAQEKLNAHGQNSGLLTNLATDLNNAASRASYLQDAVQDAFSISGAVPADHKKLNVIQDNIGEDIAVINRLVEKTNDEITHHATFLQSERSNLQTLSLGISNGELYGKSLTNSLFKKAAEGDTELFKGGTAPQASAGTTHKPLVVIRFDRPNVEYDQALYTVISQALEKYPASKFDLVAVSNLEGNAAQTALSSAEARKNGERVLRSLQDMGLPLSRIHLSASSSKSVLNSEVRIYME